MATALRGRVFLQQTDTHPASRESCSRPEDWYWSSAADYAGVRVGPLTINRESLHELVPVDSLEIRCEHQRLMPTLRPIGLASWR